MANISRLEPGQILWSPRKDRFGKVGHMRVVVIEVGTDHVIASINNNSPARYGLANIKRWKVNTPRSIGPG